MELDDESRSDLMDAFIDLQGEVETCLARLSDTQDDAQLHSLFRAVHNIKGNAGIMGLTRIVEFTHEVEEVVGAIRQKRYGLSEPLAETLFLAMDRLHDLHQQELYGKKFDYLRIEELTVLYRAMSCAESSEAEGIALQILQILGAGVVDADVDLFATEVEPTTEFIESLGIEGCEERVFADLGFFQELALQLDNQIVGWEGRSIQLFDWAMKMNKLANNPVDEHQFAAAIYMHDIGMSLLPRELWEKKRDLSPGELSLVTHHPAWGYGLLARMSGWEEAATIIYHHRECVDGSGYPNGLRGDQIHPGAKILSILDSFFFLTKGRVDSSARRSTVRAVSTINARINTEFEGMWVQCFNHMIRKELKAGNV